MQVGEDAQDLGHSQTSSYFNCSKPGTGSRNGSDILLIQGYASDCIDVICHDRIQRRRYGRD